MKKYLSFITLCLVATAMQAQDTSDAMLYAHDDLNGTARFRAMGGAFGALGGDFSSLSVNPAGSAFFSTNVAALTLTSLNKTNKSDYFGTPSKQKDNTFDLNQAGAAWVFEEFSETSKWKKVTLALNYENTTVFDNSIFSNGINPTNSITNYFKSYADGRSLSSISGNYLDMGYGQQQAALGIRGHLIAPANGSTTNQYDDAVTGTGGYYQENSIVASGYNGKLSFNIATSYKDRFYFGLNLNSHFVDYSRRTSFYEDYLDSPGHTAAGVQALRFSNDLQTFGTGFSFQVGAIARVVNGLRVGVSYESPTWYRLYDQLQQTLAVNCPDCGEANSTNGLFFADPGVTIEYPTYKLRTPGRYTGSIAYIFGQRGLLSFDYAVKDYSNTRFTPKNDYSSENTTISKGFATVSEYRIGGEYRVKQWSFRGGFRYEESPYVNSQTIGDLRSYSTGLGYRFGDTKVDLSYTFAQRDYNQSLFSQGLTEAPRIESQNHNLSLTLILEL